MKNVAKSNNLKEIAIGEVCVGLRKEVYGENGRLRRNIT